MIRTLQSKVLGGRKDAINSPMKGFRIQRTSYSLSASVATRFVFLPQNCVVHPHKEGLKAKLEKSIHQKKNQNGSYVRRVDEIKRAGKGWMMGKAGRERTSQSRANGGVLSEFIRRVASAHARDPI